MKVLSIIAQKGFQDHEFSESKKEIEAAGITVTVAAPTLNEATGKLGAKIIPQVSLSEVNIDDYDAIITIGGPGALTLGDHIEYFKILHDANKKSKIIGAICIAPKLLAKAGLLKERNATVWNEDNMQAPFLEQMGAKYTGELVTVDDTNLELVVTANGPNAANAFGKKIAELIKNNQ